MATADKPEVFFLSPKSSYGDETLCRMSQSQKDGILTDFNIKVKGNDKTIPCHKIVLSATCPYFSALFSANMKESQKGEITMENMRFDVLDNIVQYLYGNKVSVDGEMVRDILEACELLQLKDLKDQLAKDVMENISIENCIGWYKFSKVLQLEGVSQRARHLMCTDFADVSKTDEFKSLSLAELIDFIKSEDLNELDQDPLLIACIEWIDYEPVSRKETAIDILKHVTLEACSSDTLTTVTKKYQDLITDSNLKTLIYEAVLSKLKRDESNNKVLVVLGGMEGRDGTINSKCWVSPRMRYSWEEFAEIPSGSQAQQSPMVVLPYGFAIMCGGDFRTKNTEYNAESKSWRDLPQTPVALHDPTAVYCDGSLCVLDGGEYRYGGYLGTSVLSNTMYCLNLKTMKWQKGPDLLEEQCWPIAAVHHKSIYVVYNDNAVHQKPCSLQELNVNSGKWKFKQGLPENARNTQGSCLVADDSCLYLVGGLYRICAQYMINSDTWTLLAPPELKHWGASAFVSGGRIYLCGGSNDATRPDKKISEYNIEKNEWKVCDLALPKGLNFFTCAMVSFL